MKTVLVTGGAGFIGSNFIELVLHNFDKIVVLDSMTYAGHPENVPVASGKVELVRGDIRDRKLVGEIFDLYKFDAVINFAAESHVDRSIESAGEFVETNVYGVFALLDASLRSWQKRTEEEKSKFRFLQVSTDEVFGTLGDEGYFSEDTPYAPNSPYSASKAGGDHIARAWYHTYKFPVIITNCSNNYGPKQYPEKLIPFMIRCALEGKSLPVYGNGKNVRDWIHVADHCHGIYLALTKGRPGESYCFGGRSERQNLNVVEAICDELDLSVPRKDDGSYRDRIAFVEDRKGHDWRYAIDDSKAERELGFTRKYTQFEEGLRHTVQWYLENQEWMRQVLSRKEQK